MDMKVNNAFSDSETDEDITTLRYKKDKAEAYLKDKLSRGPVLQSECIIEAKRFFDIEETTVKNARLKLRYKSKQSGRHYWWSNPEVKLTRKQYQAWLIKNQIHLVDKKGNLLFRDEFEIENQVARQYDKGYSNHGTFNYQRLQDEGQKYFNHEERARPQVGGVEKYLKRLIAEAQTEEEKLRLTENLKRHQRSKSTPDNFEALPNCDKAWATKLRAKPIPHFTSFKSLIDLKKEKSAKDEKGRIVIDDKGYIVKTTRMEELDNHKDEAMRKKWLEVKAQILREGWIEAAAELYKKNYAYCYKEQRRDTMRESVLHRKEYREFFEEDFKGESGIAMSVEPDRAATKDKKLKLSPLEILPDNPHIRRVNNISTVRDKGGE
jgi:hypothetical protein